MKFHTGSLACAAAFAIIVSLMIAPPARAGGSGDEHDSHQEDDGPRYFGFVKDTAGKMISDAKVTAEIKGVGAVIARTDATGIYKLPGFGKHIQPGNVTISCAKDGYKQTRLVRRPLPTKTPVTAVETECTMQRLTK